MVSEQTVVDPPQPPSIDELLSWNADERGAIPDEFSKLGLDDVRGAVERARETAAQAERERVATEQRATDERRQAYERDRAQLQSDMDYYEKLRRDLDADDPAVKQAARLEQQQNEGRFERGLAAKLRMGEQSVMERVAPQVLQAHYAPLLEAVRGSYPEFHDGLQEFLGKHGGNPLLAAIEYGKSITAAAERAAGIEEGKRAQRIELGVAGAPDLGGGSPGTRDGRDPRTIPIAELEKMTPEQRGEAWSAFYVQR